MGSCGGSHAVVYLGLCLRGGKTRILVKKRGRKRTKRTNSHVSYQSQGGGGGGGGQGRCKGGVPPFAAPPQIHP